MEESYLSPMKEELNNIIDSLTHGKVQGQDGIPTEVIQCQKLILLQHLSELLCLCWYEGLVAMHNTNIITLYENKGYHSDCNNYRGISLLSIIGKTFVQVDLKRLQMLAKQVYPKSQCSFRA